MRSIGFPLVLASMVAAIGCSSDRALAPKAVQGGQLDFPPSMFAPYTRTSLPGTETVVALNDNGDVVGATATGGVLWHGATHERTTLPIIPTAIANDGTIAGSINGHAATWKNGHVTVLDTATSIANAICRCETATVVGSVQVNGETHAAIWADGIRIDAGVPPNSTHAEFSSIANGSLVGNAIVTRPDPRTGNLHDFQVPFRWSPAGGWFPFFPLGQVGDSRITSVNSHGIGVGSTTQFLINETNGTAFDVAAGTASIYDGAILPFFNEVYPTGINDSQRISVTAEALDASEIGVGTVALVSGFSGGPGVSPGLVLPPGVIGDQAVGINNAGVIGGQSNGLPVLWIPNP
jgi:hypothetical protein